MTYNLLAGGRDRLPSIIRILNAESPDFLALQEANGFEQNDSQKLKELAALLHLSHFELAEAAKYDFHVSSLSRYPLLDVKKINSYKTQLW